MSDRRNELSGWTIYERPLEHPDCFVARKWIVTNRQVVTTRDMFVADTLTGIRELLPPGLAGFPRDPNDDTRIVETWL